MNQPHESYSREQLIAFLAAWMKKAPSLTLAAARAEGSQRGFTVGRREYEEARILATGSPLHPQNLGTAESAPPPPPMSEAGTSIETPAVESSPPSSMSPAAVSSPPASSLPPARAESGARAAPKEARAFHAEFVRANPDSQFAALKAAAIEAGFPAPSPIEFGLARKAAGLASRSKPLFLVPAPVLPGFKKPAIRGVAPKATSTGGGDLFTELRRVVDERERLNAALIEIDRILRGAGF